MKALSYDVLREAVAGGAVGVRSRIELEPLGGPGDKLFPPTYGVADTADTRYATERRRVGGEIVDAIVLDSVASQANRFELALLEAYRNGELAIPVISVDFRGTDGLADLERLSSLEASHRVFDAALRDSLEPDSGLLFRFSEAGTRITEATPRSAGALFFYAPTTLLFGGWDSTGPRGGLGSKYERAITSEVVALGVAHGVKTASRIDALGIELKAGPVYEVEGGEWRWTLDLDEANKAKGKPVEARPSEINHGNVTPSIDRRAGGVTADSVHALVVLSFAALRKLRFPTDYEGVLISPERRRDAEVAAWTALAALGLAATVLAVEEGFDLRSRCVLAPTGPTEFALLRRDGGEPATFRLDRGEAVSLLETGVAAAAEHGLPWMRDELLLNPADRLVELVRKSREDLVRSGEVGAD